MQVQAGCRRDSDLVRQESEREAGRCPCPERKVQDLWGGFVGRTRCTVSSSQVSFIISVAKCSL